MAWSWDNYQVLLRNTNEICQDLGKSMFDGWRYSADIYDPPVERGFPAQQFTLVPALHGYSPTGVETHIYDMRMAITLNMN